MQSSWWQESEGAVSYSFAGKGTEEGRRAGARRESLQPRAEIDPQPCRKVEDRNDRSLLLQYAFYERLQHLQYGLSVHTAYLIICAKWPLTIWYMPVTLDHRLAKGEICEKADCAVLQPQDSASFTKQLSTKAVLS